MLALKLPGTPYAAGIPRRVEGAEILENIENLQSSHGYCDEAEPLLNSESPQIPPTFRRWTSASGVELAWSSAALRTVARPNVRL